MAAGKGVGMTGGMGGGGGSCRLLRGGGGVTMAERWLGQARMGAREERRQQEERTGGERVLPQIILDKFQRIHLPLYM